MKILILGADGYLGWPTCLHFASKGHDVFAIDNGMKRHWENKCKVKPLLPVDFFLKRIKALLQEDQNETIFIRGRTMDIATDANAFYQMMERFQPEVIIHYAEQPSAPYSMMMRSQAVETQFNNVIGTLNILFAMAHACPDAHLIKLGSMGEYGTPNIDIEEGFMEIEHHGRRDTLPFPKQPGSFYHLSKVHDSHNILFACRTWGLRSTDLNQGVVYGTGTSKTNETGLPTSFHYDHIFGTVINRFVVQALLGRPLTVYGSGHQKRGFLNIEDTIKCVELAALNPPEAGEYRVFNQFSELFSVLELAKRIAEITGAKIDHIPNPRTELEDHYYNPARLKLIGLGWKPKFLTNAILEEMLDYVASAKNIDEQAIDPTVLWKATP